MPFPVDEKYIAAAEGQIGARFPDAYRAMLMAKNGGHVMLGREQWSLHPIFDTSDRKRVKRTCNHVLAETRTRAGYGGFPQNAVEIGANGYGDALVLLSEGDELLPELHVFDHEIWAVRKTKWTVSDLAEKRESR